MSTEISKQKVTDLCLKYVPLGEQEELPLSYALVYKHVAKPTKKGVMPSTRDIIGFMFLCRARRLNPFVGDAYLIGYDERDGGATFTMVTGADHYLKRAEMHEQYDGFESGVVVVRTKDSEGKPLPVAEPLEREGELHLPHERVIGAWCRVYRKDRQRPLYRSVNMDAYDKKRSLWNDNKAGMIVKVVESAAHRKSFPLALGGMYSAEETAAESIDLSNIGGDTQAEIDRLVSKQIPPAIEQTEPEYTLDTSEAQAPVKEPVAAAEPQAASADVSEPPPGEGVLFDADAPINPVAAIAQEHAMMIERAKDKGALTGVFEMLFTEYKDPESRAAITALCREKGAQFE